MVTGEKTTLRSLLRRLAQRKKRNRRRAIEQGGVTFGDAKVTDVRAEYTAADFGDGVIIRRGKKTYKKVVVG